jgi:hypothetical protein
MENSLEVLVAQSMTVSHDAPLEVPEWVKVKSPLVKPFTN